jgi:hypothetical protein
MTCYVVHKVPRKGHKIHQVEYGEVMTMLQKLKRRRIEAEVYDTTPFVWLDRIGGVDYLGCQSPKERWRVWLDVQWVEAK